VELFIQLQLALEERVLLQQHEQQLTVQTLAFLLLQLMLLVAAQAAH
jgi:hypothetical protein